MAAVTPAIQKEKKSQDNTTVEKRAQLKATQKQKETNQPKKSIDR